MKKRRLLFSLLVIGSLLLPACAAVSSSGVIKIGGIGELTGSDAATGASFKNAADLAVKEVNDAGGLEVGGKKYKITLTMVDNGSMVDLSGALVDKLNQQNNVVAIIGPNEDRSAIVASDRAEQIGLSLITPRSTNPKTTLDSLTDQPKKYVFRACFSDPEQGRLLAKFALEKLGAKQAAALYNSEIDYNQAVAESFKQAFEVNGGQVVAFETYASGDKDFTEQLTKIKDAHAEVILLPNDYRDIPGQVQQAHQLGVTASILGSDSWGNTELTGLCGADCEGSYFSSHFSTQDPSPITQEFVAAYMTQYDSPPDETAALTYDAFTLLWRALQAAGVVDEETVRNALAKISQFTGITGSIQFQPGSGDPIKGAMIMQIQDGKFVFSGKVYP